MQASLRVQRPVRIQVMISRPGGAVEYVNGPLHPEYQRPFPAALQAAVHLTEVPGAGAAVASLARTLNHARTFQISGGVTHSRRSE